MKARIFVTLTLIAVLTQIPVDAVSEDHSVESVVEGNGRFAVDLYRKIADEDGNLFFSPYSISTALAMTYAGARGGTEEEMADVLHFSVGQDQLHPSLSMIQGELNDIQSQGQVELGIANSLWCAKEYPFQGSFLESNRRFYDAELRVVNFAEESGAVRITINAWVEEKTKQKIKDLIAPNGINPSTRLVLCNAIYFKGNWSSRFEKSDTENEEFHLLSGSTVSAPMMKQKSDFRYDHFGDISAIELPYDGDRLSMMIFLPNEIDGLANFESKLTFDSLNTWTSRLVEKRPIGVKVILPKFKTTRELELGGTLGDLGMPSAFHPDLADFSGMTDNKDLYIDRVIHKAFVDVNEEGTEAAAATAVIVGVSVAVGGKSAEPIFRADHPFMFVIRENQTGSILFVGRIVNPTEE